MSEMANHIRSKQNSFPQHIVEVLAPVAVEHPYSYLVPEGIALHPGALVLAPLGPREVTGVVWPATSKAKEKINPQKLKSILQAHDCPPLRKDLIDFITWMANYTLSPLGMVLRMVLRVPSAFEPEKPQKAYRLGSKQPERLTPARRRVLSHLADGLTRSKQELAKSTGVSTAVINGLIHQSALEEVYLPPFSLSPAPQYNYKAPCLSADQKKAADQLIRLVREGGFKPALLQGITGSGKTEVYFEAIAKALKQNTQVLLLLPEIALTAGFLERFAARFGAPPASWHSDLPSKHRARIWRGVASGHIRVVVGARSALFLPFKELGLIVVDEEHEAAYKQEDGVIYHARDMAVARAYRAGFPIILSSATPSLETFQNAKAGRYTHIRLKKRYADAVLPHLAAIDMRCEGPERGYWLAPRLIEAVAENLAQKQQSLLFLNRRGYAPLTLCRRCGYRFQCAHCSAWLVEHRFRNVLACHHCGHTQIKPTLCPQCEAENTLAACGPGVERIAEEVEQLFPQARTLVLSSDLAGGVQRLRRELEAITEGQIDIVIGTQLAAKGHHFPLMRLVGVIDADLALGQGDPRAAERSFQMLSQVTGRAGRQGGASFGLIQTYQPDHPVIDTLLQNAPELFYERELAERQAGGLPPFGRLAALIVSGKDKTQTAAHAAAVARAAPKMHVKNMRVFGPAEAPLALIRGRHRFRLLVRAPKTFDLPRFVHAWLKASPKARGSVRVQVDMEPVNFF